MILAIDAGNTRIKWGLRDRARKEWLATGSASVSELERLHEAWQDVPAPQQIAIANVAGPAVRGTLAELVERWSVEPKWLQSEAESCGIKNDYLQPQRLGVDRWAAMIAAWAAYRQAALVVMAGTATTIDVLDERGHFRGGVILPGMGVMKRSLVENTAALAMAPGNYKPLPRTTEDAIESGCVNAQLGAIERMHRELPSNAPCILSGGGAPALLRHLNIPVQHVEHLVLEGVVRLAEQ
ncbi:MAG TPA: type III pantothenate kinase [Burkholderiales bacterium]|nr:type III pantothenate kinase [Burkholderiales bacterium]